MALLTANIILKCCLKYESCPEKVQYRKVPKFWDTRKLCCNHPKTGKKRFYH